MSERAIVREVGPRDGLQLVKAFVPTERKLAWCRAEAAAGIIEIEATSFVPPHVIPQFADADAVAKGVQEISGLRPSALVVNLKGAMRAFESGLTLVNYVISASEEHSLANARRSTAEALEEYRKIVAERAARGLADKVRLTPGIATAFGCTMQGEVPETAVLKLAEGLIAAGADEILLADTVGYGNPGQVRRLFAGLAGIAGKLPMAAHFHDTRGLGLANVTAALEVGVRKFDASLAGLGGCPFAPGATGNVNTEDTVFLLESLGFDTGADIEALVGLRAEVEGWLPGERFAGAISRAGLPKNFRKAA